MERGGPDLHKRESQLVEVVSDVGGTAIYAKVAPALQVLDLYWNQRPDDKVYR